MNASQYAGTVIVPTLSRIVLCAAFFTAGWAKVFTSATYSPDEVAILQKLDVDVAQTVAMRDTTPGVVKASMPMTLIEQDEPGEPQGEPAQDEPAQDEPAQDEPARPDAPAQDDDIPAATDLEEEVAAPPPAPPTSQPLADATNGEAEALALYKVAITLDQAGWQYARWLAWAAALGQLVGGALLLVGLFSRVWGLGLAITMALAFHIMSMDAYLEEPFEVARKLDGDALYSQVYSQLALFVLAFGIFITGPGPLSLDRAIFRRNAPDDVDIDINESP